MLKTLRTEIQGCSLFCNKQLVFDFTASKKVSEEEINEAFKNNQNETLKFTMDPVVSTDILGKRVGALVDGQLTTVLECDGKQLVKVVAWYDNEYGYSSQMVRTARKLMQK